MLDIAVKNRRKTKGITINLNVPQAMGQQSSGGSYRSATAGLIFANPVMTLLIIAAILASVVIVGGLSLELFIGLLLNPWSWAAALIIGMLADQPRTSTIIGFSIIIGLAVWGWSLYQDYTAIPQICSYPIIGWIACGAIDIITFIPKLFILGLTILVSFIQLWVVSFAKYELIR